MYTLSMLIVTHFYSFVLFYLKIYLFSCITKHSFVIQLSKYLAQILLLSIIDQNFIVKLANNLSIIYKNLGVQKYNKAFVKNSLILLNVLSKPSSAIV